MEQLMKTSPLTKRREAALPRRFSMQALGYLRLFWHLLKLLENFRQDSILIFQVFENDRYFFLGLRVHCEVGFGSRLGVPSLKVLSDQKERHEEDLYHV